MTKSCISLLTFLSIIFLETSVFADAGPIYLLACPAYFTFIALIAVGSGVYILIRGTVDIIKLVFVDSIDKQRIIKAAITIFLLLILIIILVSFATDGFMGSLGKTMVVVILYSPLFGFYISSLFKQYADNEYIWKSRDSLLKYSFFILGIDTIIVCGILVLRFI